LLSEVKQEDRSLVVFTIVVIFFGFVFVCLTLGLDVGLAYKYLGL